MTNVLGLPLDSAVRILTEEGVSDISIQRYTAPRDENTRGTLRVVRVKDNVLTVCLFPDDVMENQNDKEPV